MPTQYNLTPVRWTQAGVGGTVTAVVTAPDGSTQALQATTSVTWAGWTVWFTPQQIGDHTVTWTSTGGQTATATVTVTAAVTASSVITINDCYATLKLQSSLIGTDADRDRDMLDYARAAVGIVEGITGPVAPTTVTQVFDGGQEQLLLHGRPRSIVAVTSAGVPLTGWSCDFVAGVLSHLGGFPTGRRNIEVRYTVGSGQVPPNVMLGIREVFRQLWERSRALGGQASPDMVMQGFAVPNAVYELLAPNVGYPGFA